MVQTTCCCTDDDELPSFDNILKMERKQSDKGRIAYNKEGESRREEGDTII